VGDRRRLPAVGRAELGEDVRDVDAHGAHADVERVGDLAVRRAAREVLQDLDLARGQIQVRPGLRRLAGVRLRRGGR
jgi:hypothetical protein